MSLRGRHVQIRFSRERVTKTRKRPSYLDIDLNFDRVLYGPYFNFHKALYGTNHESRMVSAEANQLADDAMALKAADDTIEKMED